VTTVISRPAIGTLISRDQVAKAVLMGNPCVDGCVLDVVVTKRLDQDLSAARELTSKNPMWAVRLVERSSAVPDRAA
jgi:hypothetical protein